MKKCWRCSKYITLYPVKSVCIDNIFTIVGKRSSILSVSRVNQTPSEKAH